MEYGRQGPRVNPKNEKSPWGEEHKAYYEKIGEPVPRIDLSSGGPGLLFLDI
jgi:hypothetical protein